MIKPIAAAIATLDSRLNSFKKRVLFLSLNLENIKEKKKKEFLNLVKRIIFYLSFLLIFAKFFDLGEFCALR